MSKEDPFERVGENDRKLRNQEIDVYQNRSVSSMPIEVQRSTMLIPCGHQVECQIPSWCIVPPPRMLWITPLIVQHVP